jgi:hypothetical protein
MKKTFVCGGVTSSNNLAKGTVLKTHSVHPLGFIRQGDKLSALTYISTPAAVCLYYLI